jgi:hypothetical protein
LSSSKTPGTPVWMLDQHLNPPNLVKELNNIITFVFLDYSNFIKIT